MFNMIERKPTKASIQEKFNLSRAEEVYGDKSFISLTMPLKSEPAPMPAPDQE